MKSENEKIFLKGLRCINTGRSHICKSLQYIQNTPILDKNDVNIVSDAIDSLDRSIAKLKQSYQKKSEWVE